MIRKLDHLGIAVRSISEARPLYEALGLAVEAVEEVPGEGVRVAMISCGETRIELLEPTSPDSPVARFLATRGPGLHHLCLATDDLRADDARLRRAGYRLLRERPTRGAAGCWIQFVHPKSAGGVLVELSQEGGAEPPVVEPTDAEPVGVEPAGAESTGAEPGGAEPAASGPPPEEGGR
ncbi:MAG TPA: methylmalonyl-CoA epimerase [Thermoanaerobaculia bacterium]|nr:methylmalonyl-CoA epimerase [Thermoanaerobaculia bacterium]